MALLVLKGEYINIGTLNDFSADYIYLVFGEGGLIHMDKLTDVAQCKNRLRNATKLNPHMVAMYNLLELVV